MAYSLHDSQLCTDVCRWRKVAQELPGKILHQDDEGIQNRHPLPKLPGLYLLEEKPCKGRKASPVVPVVALRLFPVVDTGTRSL